MLTGQDIRLFRNRRCFHRGATPGARGILAGINGFRAFATVRIYYLCCGADRVFGRRSVSCIGNGIPLLGELALRRGRHDFDRVSPCSFHPVSLLSGPPAEKIRIFHVETPTARSFTPGDGNYGGPSGFLRKRLVSRIFYW